MPTYIWADHTQVAVDPNVAGRQLEKLAAKGEVTATTVLRAARRPSSPLHPAFEWDDQRAGELYRLGQARYIVRSIRVIEEDGGEPERVFYHVRTEKVDAYVTKVAIMADDELRQAALREALAMLNAARSRYRELKELSSVWDAIDQLELQTV